jgi:PqqD family protein of HPr-rel-A system
MMPAIKPKTRNDLAVVELDGEAVIYDEASGDLHHLNPTATIIFNLFDGTATVKELAALIEEEFKVPANEVEKQIRALMKEFRSAGLLDGKPSANGS